jgi:hypothetical protein
MQIFDWTKDCKIPESAAATTRRGREPTTSTTSPTRMTQPNQQTETPHLLINNLQHYTPKLQTNHHSNRDITLRFTLFSISLPLFEYSIKTPSANNQNQNHGSSSIFIPTVFSCQHLHFQKCRCCTCIFVDVNNVHNCVYSPIVYTSSNTKYDNDNNNASTHDVDRCYVERCFGHVPNIPGAICRFDMWFQGKHCRRYCSTQGHGHLGVPSQCCLYLVWWHLCRSHVSFGISSIVSSNVWNRKLPEDYSGKGCL